MGELFVEFLLLLCEFLDWMLGTLRRAARRSDAP